MSRRATTTKSMYKMMNLLGHLVLVFRIHAQFLPSTSALRGSKQTFRTEDGTTTPTLGLSKASIISTPLSSLLTTPYLSVTTTGVLTSMEASSAPTRTSLTSSITPTSVLLPTQIPTSTAQQDIDIIQERRLSSIVGALTGRAGGISAWLLSLGSDGKWPDVDYTTGCAARRANWPAQEHWQRIVVMAAGWHGGLQDAEQYVNDNTTRAAISRAMDYWFLRDFTNIACLDAGGTAQCPCINPDDSLWNTNWFSNIILIPDLVGQGCLLLGPTLMTTEALGCVRMTTRSFNTFDKDINGVGFLTGANTLDVAAIGIDLALLTNNVTALTDAYRRIHLELSLKGNVGADGIRPDGSFGQHGGILYNGNYGKDFTNDILGIEIEAGGTQFAANATAKVAFATLFDGDRWMIYRNAVAGVLHWDFSALGRFISFPVIDNQATGSIKINLTQVQTLGQQWSSATLINFANSLSRNTSNANAGSLKGNRLFYANDYMVHRGRNYVSTVKMFSSRTQNTECVNSQNPLGFHLADGAVHTYLRGDEYEDIALAWDWNLIPGTTVDYGATPLSCDRTQFMGVERFVGGASDGKIGLAVMRYTNPSTRSLHWQKAWFFLDNDVQHVMVANISSTTSSPVYSVLDQRRHSSAVVVDQEIFSGTKAQTLWHGDVGYVLPIDTTPPLSVQVGEKDGNWSAIGTSTQPPVSVDLFAAWLQHTSLSPISYTVLPGISRKSFHDKGKRLRLRTVQNDAQVSAIFDELEDTAMIVFWNVAGGSTTIRPLGKAALTVSATGNLAIIYTLKSSQVVISDPSQTLLSTQVTISLGSGKKPPHWSGGLTKTFVITLPQGGIAGSSVTHKIH